MEDFKMPTWAKWLIGFVIVLLIALILKGLFLNFVDSYEVGYKFDKRSGKLTTLNRTGWVVTPPFVVSVHTVDIRPVQVCINANARVLNCKLVQFDTKGLDLFLSWHGRNDYEIGSDPNYQGSFPDILRSYAYSGDVNGTYPFLKILKELKPEDSTKDTLQ